MPFVLNLGVESLHLGMLWGFATCCQNIVHFLAHLLLPLVFILRAGSAASFACDKLAVGVILHVDHALQHPNVAQRCSIYFHGGIARLLVSI